MPIGPYFSNQVLNFIFRATAISAPSNFYLRAFVGDPRITSGMSAGVELTASNGYAAIPLPTYSTPVNNLMYNTAVATWPECTPGNWTPGWNWIGIFDAPTGGNCWWAGQINTVRNITTGMTPSDPIGALGLQMVYGIASYLGNQLLNLFNLVNITPTGTFYFAPYAGAPLSGGTELTTYGATRIGLPSFSPASNGTIVNTSAANFGTATGNWASTCTHMAIVDALSAGNILAQAALRYPLTIGPGDVPTLAVGSISPSLV